MSSFLRWSLAQTTLLVVGLTSVTVNPIAVSAQTTTPSTTLSQSNTRTNNNIVAIAASNPSLTTLTTLLKAAGLTDTLQQPGPYTVFAPTDQAFAALPAGTVEQLQKPENKQLLIQILQYHLVRGALTANQLTNGELTTAESSPVNIKVDRTNNQVTVNDARVTQPNIRASNGVIHVIDQVLIPPNLNTSQQPSTDSSQTPTTGTTNTDTSQTPTTGTTNTDSSQTPTTGTTGTESSQAPMTDTEVTPGRATRGGSSYIGVAGNVGILGNSSLSSGNVAVISKIGLTNYFSVRPSAVFGDRTVVLVPLTLDLAPRAVNPAGNERFPISPFVGAGVAIQTNDDTDVGLLLTGGLDIPLGDRFTLNGTANAAFLDRTDLGLLFGVGYNF